MTPRSDKSGDDPPVLTDLARPRETQLLVRRQRPIVEETCRHRVRGLGKSLHGPTAESRDQLERPGHRRGSHALTPVSVADVTAPDPPVRRVRLTLLIGRGALDPRKLCRSAELAPAQAVPATEDESRVCRTRAHTLQLAFTVQPRGSVRADALRMERHAPAAAEDAVVSLHQRGEPRPRRLFKRPNLVGGHTHRPKVALGRAGLEGERCGVLT